MIRLRIQIEPNKPVLEEGYTLFPGWYHLVVVGIFFMAFFLLSLNKVLFFL